MGKGGTNNQKLFLEIEKLNEVVKQSGTHIATIQKELNDTQWYLGEEKAKSQRLQEDVRDKIHYIQGLEEELQNLRRRHEESEWYLGEEKERRAQLEVTLQSAEQKCEDMEFQLNEMRARYDAIQKELNDTQWYLGEERGWRQKLEEQVRTYVNFEKRRYPRFSVDLPMEYTWGDSVAKQGRVINVSESGLLVYCAEQMEIGQALRLKLFFPSGSELNMMEIVNKVVWMDVYKGKDWGDYRSGVKFVDISPVDVDKLKSFLVSLPQ